jgi:formylmethanofuran dehydrogenase subunit D
MLQDKKLENQKLLEEYLEENRVYEIFEDMMKSLIMTKPKDPVSYLL